MRKLLFIIMVAVLVPVVGLAEERGFGKNRMKIFEALNLDKDQIVKVKKLHREEQKKMVKLRSEMELKRIDFREELQKTQQDKDTIVKLIEEMAGLAAQRHRIRLETRVEMMEILTPEQKERLTERMSERIIRGGGRHPDDDFDDRPHRGWKRFWRKFWRS